MTLIEIQTAVSAGKTVHWATTAYRVIRDEVGQWLIVCDNGHCIGLTWLDGETMNGRPNQFFVA